MLAEQLLAEEIQAAVTSNYTADCKLFGTWSLSSACPQSRSTRITEDTLCPQESLCRSWVLFNLLEG